MKRRPLWRLYLTMMIHPYCEKWDKKVNYLMKNHQFKKVNEYIAKLGNYTIWIANHPYDSFTKSRGSLSVKDLDNKVRPSRKTIYKLQEKLIKETNDNNSQTS